MTVGSVIDLIGACGGLTKPVSRETEQTAPFTDILRRLAETVEKAEGTPFKASRSLKIPQMKIIEKRPSCIICGMTISSEGTCMCAYPTVISNRGGVSLNHNSSAQTENSGSVGESKKPQISETGDTTRDTEKVKLRRRCLICGSAVSDSGSCMCDTEKKADKAPQPVVKVPKIRINLSHG